MSFPFTGISIQLSWPLFLRCCSLLRNEYRRFCRNCTTLSQPATDLMKQSRMFLFFYRKSELKYKPRPFRSTIAVGRTILSSRNTTQNRELNYYNYSGVSHPWKLKENVIIQARRRQRGTLFPAPYRFSSETGGLRTKEEINSQSVHLCSRSRLKFVRLCHARFRRPFPFYSILKRGKYLTVTPVRSYANRG